MSQVASLWPTEIFSQTRRTPLAVIKEQAEALGHATKNLVEGGVRVSSMGEDVHITFNFVVPTMKNYTYRLFTATHGPYLYPVTLSSPAFTDDRTRALGGQNSEKVNNEDELNQALKTIFNDEDTKKIVVALLAQAQS